MEWNKFEYVLALTDVFFVVCFIEKFTDTAAKLEQKYFYFITLFKCYSTVCDIFFFSLIPNISLAKFLTCLLSFWGSEPHVSYERVSYMKKNALLSLVFRFLTAYLCNFVNLVSRRIKTPTLVQRMLESIPVRSYLMLYLIFCC